MASFCMPMPMHTGILPFVTVGSFFVGMAVAFVPASRPLPGFKQFFELGMKVFG